MHYSHQPLIGSSQRSRILLEVVHCNVSFVISADRLLGRMGAWVDLSLMAVTFLCTVAKDVELGVTCSIIFSLLLVVRKASRPSLEILGHIPGTLIWKSVNDFPEAEEDIPGVFIVQLKQSLDFGRS